MAVAAAAAVGVLGDQEASPRLKNLSEKLWKASVCFFGVAKESLAAPWKM